MQDRGQRPSHLAEFFSAILFTATQAGSMLQAPSFVYSSLPVLPSAATFTLCIPCLGNMVKLCSILPRCFPAGKKRDTMMSMTGNISSDRPKREPGGRAWSCLQRCSPIYSSFF